MAMNYYWYGNGTYQTEYDAISEVIKEHPYHKSGYLETELMRCANIIAYDYFSFGFGHVWNNEFNFLWKQNIKLDLGITKELKYLKRFKDGLSAKESKSPELMIRKYTEDIVDAIIEYFIKFDLIDGDVVDTSKLTKYTLDATVIYDEL